MMRANVHRQAEGESKDWPVSIERYIKRLRLIGSCGERNMSRALSVLLESLPELAQLPLGASFSVCDRNESKQSKRPNETA